MEKSKIYSGIDRTNWTDKQVMQIFLKELYEYLKEKFKYGQNYSRLVGRMYGNNTINKYSAVCVFRCNSSRITEHSSSFILLTYKFKYTWLKIRETKIDEYFSQKFAYHISVYETNTLYINML